MCVFCEMMHTHANNDTHVCCSLVQLRKKHETLRKARLDEFMAGFNIISLKLKEMYQVRFVCSVYACV